MPLFPKQAANSLVTETLQYFVFFCRSVYSAILAKCLIINDLRLILVILFFIAFLNITYSARHTAATTVFLGNEVSIENVAKILGHSNIKMTQHYAKVLDSSIMRDMINVERNFL
ncbi:recombinase [Parabacteroides sp. 20_3]|uniref:tyrosine-type recombinase/integrase n=1 Tax=Parabacteroides sp. 20_3 TaxID=469591 RepID=UPI000EF00A0E|nr:tyrosine-type recombinase/integrase [Parabacteroides sp. 20_3]RGK78004.1 recombinase [Parabacteroides sp. 20_3]